MSRLGCKCGHTMGSSECPNPYGLYVYYAHEVEAAIAANDKLRLLDFTFRFPGRTHFHQINIITKCAENVQDFPI